MWQSIIKNIEKQVFPNRTPGQLRGFERERVDMYTIAIHAPLDILRINKNFDNGSGWLIINSYRNWTSEPPTHTGP